MRYRIRALIAALGIAATLCVVAGPAFAQETKPAHYATEADRQCAEKLANGQSVDDCQKAPSPLLPAKNEIIWGSLAFLVLFVAMWKWGVPAVKNMERAREDRIRNDLETAERARTDAETAACDAQTVPVVTGTMAPDVIDKMIALARTAAEATSDASAALSSEAWRALRYAMARLAVDLVSGPAGVAAILRQGLLAKPYNTPSLPLDIGYSDSIPAHIRRAVLLRDRTCAWPKCGRLEEPRAQEVSDPPRPTSPAELTRSQSLRVRPSQTRFGPPSTRSMPSAASPSRPSRGS